MNKTTDSFLRIEAIFHEALDTADLARNELIDARCEGDTSMKAEVYSLLEACRAEEAEAARRDTGAGSTRDTDLQSRRIGPYQIDRLLGRGGMGAVYLAHRADGHFEQKVAIKLIDLPLATAIFRERFRQERQILAALQHPYIARLLDGGVTENSDLYLAMEYVDGVPIHTFCEQHKLSISQRLELFIHVCEAVQFAHQNFVVHRDLKPDNIFVAEDRTPRLLDFGTAKLLAQSAVNTLTELTREGFHSFTPQYASPEQVLGTPITTASDTYSLGVLLYLLLTGTHPYELKEPSTAELLRVICEKPPRKPSRSAVSSGKLDSDLEAILLKALRKEPEQRYRTAEQLAADVQAYLDGKPVAARRGTIRYRTTKFFFRHRLAIFGAAALALTLLAGIVGVLWQAKVANEERQTAEARSADLRQLSSSLLSELDEAIKDLPGSTGAQNLLVTRVLEHLDRMAKDAKGDRLTQLDLVDAYTRLGNIQGNAYDQNLGDAEGGLASLAKAANIAKPLVNSGPSNRDAVRALALVQQSSSEILWQMGDTPKAIDAMHQALSSFDRLIANPNATPALIGEAAAAYGTLGDELGQPGTSSEGNIAEALSVYRKTIDLDNRALKIDPNFLRAKRGLAIMQMKIGSLEMGSDPEQALKDFKIALERADALPKAEQDSLPTMRLRSMLERKVADALDQLGEYESAIPYFDQASQIDRRMASADPEDSRSLFDLEIVQSDEAESFEDSIDPVPANPSGHAKRNLMAAERLWADNVKIMETMLKGDRSFQSRRPVLAIAQIHLGTVRTELHETAGSAETARAGLAAMRKAAQQEQAPPLILDQTANLFLSVQPASLRDPAFAISCAEREVALTHRQKSSALLTLALAYRAAGQFERSRATAVEGLALLPPAHSGKSKSNIRSGLEEQAR